MILFILAWLIMGLISHLLNEFCHRSLGFHQEFDGFGDIAVIFLGPVCGIISIIFMVICVVARGIGTLLYRIGKKNEPMD